MLMMIPVVAIVVVVVLLRGVVLFALGHVVRKLEAHQVVLLVTELSHWN